MTKTKNYGFNVEHICDMILDCKTFRQVADSYGCSTSPLMRYIDSTKENANQVREARRTAQKLWEEKAAEALDSVTDGFSMFKAKELANHYRWRAQRIAPLDYGDKVQQDVNVSGSTDNNITITFVNPTPSDPN